MEFIIPNEIIFVHKTTLKHNFPQLTTQLTNFTFTKNNYSKLREKHQVEWLILSFQRRNFGMEIYFLII